MIQTPELVQNYYSSPFKYDGYSYVWDDHNNMCLMTMSHNQTVHNFMGILVDIMNGKDFKIHPEKTFSIKNGEVLLGDRVLFIVRGWGRLQYIKDENPELIQDTFGQWVVDLLNDSIEK